MQLGFSIAVCGLSIRIQFDRSDTAQAFERHLLPTFPRPAGETTSSSLDFQITSSAGTERLRLSSGDVLLTEARAWPETFTALQQRIDEAVVRQLSEQAAVHAGVVAYRGNAILLPGASRSGKTTLVRELARRGAEYFSDEYALVDSAGMVHPYPRAMMVRDGRGVQHPVLPRDCGEVGQGAARARFLFFLTHQAGARFEVHSVTQSDSLLYLLRNTPHVLAEQPGVLPHLQAAARAATAFGGIRGDASEAAEEILRVVDRAS